MQFPEFQKLRDLDVELGSGHTAYRRSSLIDLYPYIDLPNFIKIEKKTLWTNGRTDVRTDVRTDGRTDVSTEGHFRPPLML